MSVTSGFYNAVLVQGEWDREYTAEQFSQIFDGLVNDGVYASIGAKFMVTPDSSTNMRVVVGSGRAWFDHTWTLNDSGYFVTLDNPDASRPRIDAIIIEIDSTSRENRITKVKGTPNSNPVKPTLDSNQYPLAYVRVNAGNPYVIQAGNIENAVGTTACPYVTGIIQSLSIDQIVAQWQALWESWISNEQINTQAILDNLQTEIDEIDASSNFDLPPVLGYDIELGTNLFTTYTPSPNTEEYNIYSKGYSYRAKIPLPGVLAGMRPYVTWSLPSIEDAGADILNQCQCVTNGVYVYATSRPAAAITALTVECRRNSGS